MAAKIRVVGMRDPVPDGSVVVNTTSRSKDWGREFSPFLLGPVKLWGSYTAQNVENAWQYTKVYRGFTDHQGIPSEHWYVWAKKGWAKQKADRYPMGRGAKPVFSWWDTRSYSYVEARMKIYVPLYAGAVVATPAWSHLKRLHQQERLIYLRDFDGYAHRESKMHLLDVMVNPRRPMGHAFVLMAMLKWGENFWRY